MTEKTEWEVVDDGGQPNESDSSNVRPTTQQLLRAMLGPYWRWKLAGFFILTAITLAILAAFVGVIVLILSAAAIVLFATSRIRRWLQRRSGTHLPKNPEQ